jgi:hypothetical protein
MYDIIFCSKHEKNQDAFEKFRLSYPNAKWLPNVTTISQAVSSSVKMSMTSMHWLITDDVIIHPDIDLTWKTETWDRPYPHIWKTVDHLGNPVDEFAGVYLIPNRYQVSPDELTKGVLSRFKSMEGAQQVLKPYDVVYASYDVHRNIAHAAEVLSNHCATEMHWIIMDDVKLKPNWDLNWRPFHWDRKYVHVWKTADTNGTALNHTGVYLVPGNYQTSGDEIQQGSLNSIKPMPDTASIAVPHDIFFISYQEPNAAEYFKMLQDRFPRAQHVHGIKGIHNAHMRCAELSQTSMFWTVDADTLVDNGFEFDYRPPDYDRQYLHLWHSRNPVNDLSYGWGAIKLWPTQLVREFRSNWLDFTTSVGNIKIIPDVVATSNYNCDKISTWRSGFRESVKLCHNIAQGDHVESLERLVVWLTVANEVDYAKHSLYGARAGVEFYISCKEQGNISAIKNINDFDWLIDRFNNRRQSNLETDRSLLLSKLRD